MGRKAVILAGALPELDDAPDRAMGDGGGEAGLEGAGASGVVTAEARPVDRSVRTSAVGPGRVKTLVRIIRTQDYFAKASILRMKDTQTSFPCVYCCTTEAAPSVFTQPGSKPEENGQLE